MARNRDKRAGLSRREFIRLAGLSALSGAGAPLFLHGGPLWAQEGTAPAAATAGLEYRQMGRLSEVKVAAFIGNESLRGAVFERAVEMGVNYWHKFGGRERFETIKKAGRDRHYIEITRDPKETAEAIYQDVKRALQSTGADFADFYKSHTNYTPACLEAYRRLHQEGLVRYLSASVHGWGPVKGWVDQGDLHQVQVSVNALSGPKAWETVQYCAEKGVGFIAMKTMLGGSGKWAAREDLKGRLAPYLPSDGSIAQALIKAVLAKPGVTGVVVVTGNLQHLEENVQAAREPLRETEARGLNILTAALTSEVCRLCGTCSEACPRDIAVCDIMRYEMYATGYGERDRAHRLYCELPPEQRAQGCDRCGLCEQACPHGLKVVERLTRAHQLLA